MLTSEERAELRAQANTLDTTLIVGKSGITDTLIAEADNQLTARELVKGKVLEGALLSPREASDAICEATGADGVAVIGTKFVIYRFSEKLQEERNQTVRVHVQSAYGIDTRSYASKERHNGRSAFFVGKACNYAARLVKQNIGLFGGFGQYPLALVDNDVVLWVYSKT